MITGLLLEDEFLDAQYYQRSEIVRRIYIVLIAMVLAGLIAWLAFGQSFIGMILICGAVGALGGEFLTRWIILPRRLKRIFKQTEGYKTPFTYSWNQEALTVEGQTGNARRPWSHYIKWRESDKAILLYHSDAMFELIPKRWFTSPAQYDSFRSALSRIGT